MNGTLRIYCGGRFHFDCRDEGYKETAAKDYRSRLLGDVEKMLSGSGETMVSDSIIYIGPYYFETDDMNAPGIVHTELSMIENCTDAVFVLDEADCPGTITELIYAATKGKRIHIFYKRYADQDETESVLHTPCWFPITAAQEFTEVAVYKYDDYDTVAENIKDLCF